MHVNCKEKKKKRREEKVKIKRIPLDNAIVVAATNRETAAVAVALAADDQDKCINESCWIWTFHWMNALSSSTAQWITINQAKKMCPHIKYVRAAKTKLKWMKCVAARCGRSFFSLYFQKKTKINVYTYCDCVDTLVPCVYVWVCLLKDSVTWVLGNWALTLSNSESVSHLIALLYSFTYYFTHFVLSCLCFAFLFLLCLAFFCLLNARKWEIPTCNLHSFFLRIIAVVRCSLS